MCDPTCNAKEVQELTFTLSGFNLEPLFQEGVDSNQNATSLLPAPYFVIVKAVTGKYIINCCFILISVLMPVYIIQ